MSPNFLICKSEKMLCPPCKIIQDQIRKQYTSALRSSTISMLLKTLTLEVMRQGQGASTVVQQLRLRILNAGGLGSLPECSGTWIPHRSYIPQ